MRIERVDDTTVKLFLHIAISRPVDLVVKIYGQIANVAKNSFGQ